MTGQTRLHIGVQHERKVAARIAECGWAVQPWPAMLVVVRKMLAAGWSETDVAWWCWDCLGARVAAARGVAG